MTAARFDLNDAVRSTLALVLAGGRGSRLHALTDHVAKPAVPFAGKFRIIDFPLSNCINSGIRRIGVLTQYRAHELIRHIQRGWSFPRAELNEFIELWPAQQQTGAERWYLGTADAVFQNLAVIRSHGPRYVLVLAGDHVYRQDYTRLLRWHIEHEADVTVSCVEVPREGASAFGIVDAGDDGRIRGFLEKPSDPPAIPGRPDRCYASMGIYVFNAPMLLAELERDATQPGSKHDFGHDILPSLMSRGRLFAHAFSDSCVASDGATEPYWRDVGTLDAFWAANLDFTAVTPQLDLYGHGWPIWTYHEQRPAAKFVFDDAERRGMAIDSVVSAGCIVSGGAVRRSLLFTDVRVNSYSVVEDSVLLPRCDIGRRARIRKAVVAPDTQVPEGLVVGEDPAADANRFHRSEGGVTLVTADMIAAL